MRFGNHNFAGRELADKVQFDDEHLALFAEERIKQLHRHKDGSEIEISIKPFATLNAETATGLEGKIAVTEHSSLLTRQEEAAVAEQLKQQQMQQGRTEAYTKEEGPQLQQQRIGYERSQQQKDQQLPFQQQPKSNPVLLATCNCGDSWTLQGNLNPQPNQQQLTIAPYRTGSPDSGERRYGSAGAATGAPGKSDYN